MLVQTIHENDYLLDVWSATETSTSPTTRFECRLRALSSEMSLNVLSQSYYVRLGSAERQDLCATWGSELHSEVRRRRVLTGTGEADAWL